VNLKGTDMDIDQTIAMLRQIRWREAQSATGGENDLATTRLIRAHQTLEALEAAKKLGEPDLAYKVDIDGIPLEPDHPWYKERAKGKSG
jgi:hypothetical protein